MWACKAESGFSVPAVKNFNKEMCSVVRRWYCVTDGRTPDLHVVPGLKRTPEIIKFNVLYNPLRPALY